MVGWRCCVGLEHLASAVPLGLGGSGAVYKAWHTRLRKHVVVKEARHGSCGNIEARRNEVEALKNIRNAYVPQVFDFLTEDGCSYAVIEYVEGESLDKLLARGHRITETQTIKWYGQLASALEAIHRQDICHRDIKPANIILTPNGDICLIDFNAARVGGNDARIVSRSPGYASPEQYELYQRYEDTRTATNNSRPDDGGTPGDDVETQFTEAQSATAPCPPNPDHLGCGRRPIDWKRSDIYSLGATMHHLLTGKRPHARADEAAPISETGGSHRCIENIIGRSMRPDPSERYNSASALAGAISNLRPHRIVAIFIKEGPEAGR